MAGKIYSSFAPLACQIFLRRPFRDILSDQARLLQCCADKAGEQGMRIKRLALQLGVELNTDEKRVVGALDDFRQQTVRGHS